MEGMSVVYGLYLGYLTDTNLRWNMSGQNRGTGDPASTNTGQRGAILISLILNYL